MGACEIGDDLNDIYVLGDNYLSDSSSSRRRVKLAKLTGIAKNAYCCSLFVKVLYGVWFAFSMCLVASVMFDIYATAKKMKDIEVFSVHVNGTGEDFDAYTFLENHILKGRKREKGPKMRGMAKGPAYVIDQKDGSDSDIGGRDKYQEFNWDFKPKNLIWNDGDHWTHGLMFLYSEYTKLGILMFLACILSMTTIIHWYIDSLVTRFRDKKSEYRDYISANKCPPSGPDCVKLE